MTGSKLDAKPTLHAFVRAWGKSPKVSLHAAVRHADNGTAHWCSACETGYELEAVLDTWDERLRVAALLRELANALDLDGQVKTPSPAVVCVECERETTNANACAVCGGEPLCPYCIGSREHDCVRSGEVDG